MQKNPNDAAYNTRFKTEMAQLTAQYREACAQPVSADKIARNEIIAKRNLSVRRQIQCCKTYQGD